MRNEKENAEGKVLKMKSYKNQKLISFIDFLNLEK